MRSTLDTIAVDVAVIGAGATGLWIANRALDQGLSVAVIAREVGGEQTLASQGIIHGGLKYALVGRQTSLSRSTRDMPERWRSCLRGDGELDLRGVEVASEQFVLYSFGANPKLWAFLGSRAVNTRATRLDTPPAPLAQNGVAYALEDLVIDSASLVEHLAGRMKARILRFDIEPEHVERDHSDGAIDCIRHPRATIHAQRYVFACGAGLAELGTVIRATQVVRRPLRQVVVELPQHAEIFAHLVKPGLNPEPEATVTTHRRDNGDTLLYMGGRIAGIDSRSDQIAAARTLLQSAAPDVDLGNAVFTTVTVDRIEPPDRQPHVAVTGNTFTCLPVKLTLVPVVADTVMKAMSDVDAIPNAWTGHEDPVINFGARPW